MITPTIPPHKNPIAAIASPSPPPSGNKPVFSQPDPILNANDGP
jgi:hypothetical protein